MDTSRKDREGNVYDFHWDQKRMGFYVSVNGKPVKDLFYKAKGTFDRSDAQEQARKMVVKLVTDAIQATDAARHYEYQYVKPLSDLEKEWAEMTNRFMKLNDKELARWEQLWKSGIIRKSLMDKTHPAIIQKDKK